MAIPDRPKIYHITHLNNLHSILRDGKLISDAEILARRGTITAIGISRIKERRLSSPIKCQPNVMVGQAVPFYFCPRSIMLYIIYRGNHPDLTYSDGQNKILHLEIDLYDAIKWADDNGVAWAFSLSNASAGYAEFRNSVEQLSEVNWESVQATDFRDPEVKDGKQAEFLIVDSCPWELVERVGVFLPHVEQSVKHLLSGSQHIPSVEVIKEWYY